MPNPHIVAGHDVGGHDGAVFVAMEIVDGRPLRQIVRRGLPIGEVLDLAVGRGLAGRGGGAARGGIRSS